MKPKSLTKKKSQVFLWSGAVAFLIGMLLTPGFNSFETPDVASVQHVVKTGQMGLPSPPGPLYVQGADDLYYSVHEVGSLLASIPFGVLASVVEEQTGLPFADVFLLMMSFVAAGLFALTYVILLRAADSLGLPLSFMTIRLLAVLLGSQYLIYGLVPTDVSFSALLLAAIFLFWVESFQRSDAFKFWVGFVLGLAVLFKVTNLAMLPVLIFLIVTAGRDPFTTRIKRLMWFGLGIAPGIAGTLLWNQVRTGHPFKMPYQFMHNFDITWFPEGLLGTLLSPGKGLLIYTPTLVLLLFAFGAGGYFKRLPRIAIFLCGGFLIALIRIAGSESWTGGSGWGIRYYVPWIPLLLFGVVAEWTTRQRSLIWKRSIFILLGLGLWINLSGTLTNHHFREMLYGYHPWTLLNPAVGAMIALPENMARLAGHSLGLFVVPGASERTMFVSNHLTVWWYGIQTVGVPPFMSWAIGLSLAAAAWFCSRKLLEVIREK